MNKIDLILIKILFEELTFVKDEKNYLFIINLIRIIEERINSIK